MTSPVRVAVNGYGVIGKRVADAVRLQDAGLPVAGSLDDLIAASDIVVDATPKTVAGQDRERG